MAERNAVKPRYCGYPECGFVVEGTAKDIKKHAEAHVLKSVQTGIKQAEEGELGDFGSFAEYANDPIE